MNNGDNWSKFAGQTSNTLGYGTGDTSGKNALNHSQYANADSGMTFSYDDWQNLRWNKLINAAKNKQPFKLSTDELNQLNGIISRWKGGGDLTSRERQLLSYFTEYGVNGDSSTGGTYQFV